MLLPWAVLLPLIAQHTVFASAPAKRFYESHNYYVLQHDPSTGVSLNDVARALDVHVVEQAGELVNHWLVRVEKPAIEQLSQRDEAFDRVLDTYQRLRTDSRRSNVIASAVPYLERQTLRRRIKRAPPPIRPPPDETSQAVADRLDIQDPLFTKQWHLVNDDFPEHSMNATGVWEMGLTGKGIITSFVDDGLDYTSEDLKDNFDAEDSYDFNDHELLPTPKLSDDHHGTRCAGQVAAGKNNKACGVGIAYDSKVAGVRILSGAISDVDEAASLNYGFQNVSIYSCSWGPPDNGKSMEGPSYLIKKAVVNGINYGRGGKGSVYVFASGNGAAHNDQCNFDGYTNSIYSVTVSAVDYKGLHPYYSEPCAANMIVAYSSGSGKSITTTDKGKNSCSSSHGGTSAAAPNAAGVFALALEARPDLTWRDIQHLCVLTARQINLDDPDWEPTALPGRPYSYKYGFGALDAYRYIKAAIDWQLVKPQAWFHTKTIQLEGGVMPEFEQYSGGQFITEAGVSSTMSITKEMLAENNFEKLEHVNVKVWIDHSRRGDVEVEIRSPTGIRSVLAGKRSGDAADTGFPGWTFMSVKHWGEDPIGDWTIKVSDQHSESQNGSFLGWNMVFWGSAIDVSKATLFEVPHDETDVMLPPPDEPRPSPTATIASASATKQHTKPTEHLPGDHVDAPGENTNATFPGGQTQEEDTAVVSASPSPLPTSSPTADEGWFSDMGNLVKSQAWFFGAIGAVAVFGIAAGVYFWRRRVLRLRNYSTVPAGDELPMSGVRSGRVAGGDGGGARSKELYDAFGEVSDDDEDEDADEQTRLRPDDSRGGRSSQYRDEPEGDHHHSRAGGAASPDEGSPSDGSWEHASS
ncbi:peptidase S8/S53 domain-containing protein [Roridomyces roridus]|uniref:Peptidase S8/S53 domain-containing protein n=1 Tax=Roridomyces roridus TaxID=1738132 RepID=A0AAD7BX61_9AGAR|nr:peptidase S8/S53 domain-containing protein [Roridomyces roridus]